jgi:hypothetical protein
MEATNNLTKVDPKPAKRLRTWLSFVAMLAIAALVAPLAWAQHEQEKDSYDTFTLDVALDAATLVINHVDPTQPPTLQLVGDVLVIEGTIYRGGTLPSGIADNDPKASGGIGKIRCRALVLIPPTDLTTPAATFVTELYSLPDDKQTIIADGPGANLFATVYRAVLGGTQGFQSVTGQLVEQNLGTNKSGACNLRITFRVRRSGSEKHG